jgi:hypothetical protein
MQETIEVAGIVDLRHFWCFCSFLPVLGLPFGLFSVSAGKK